MVRLATARVLLVTSGAVVLMLMPMVRVLFPGDRGVTYPDRTVGTPRMVLVMVRALYVIHPLVGSMMPMVGLW